MGLVESFNLGRSSAFGPDATVRSWVATERYCGDELAALFKLAGGYLQLHWATLRDSQRLAHHRPQRELPWPLPPYFQFAPGLMFEQWSLRFDNGHFHAFLESCPDAEVDGEPLGGVMDWHVQDDSKRSGNKWSSTGAWRVSQAWQGALADAKRRAVQELTWCYQAGQLEGVQSPLVYLRDGGKRIWCEMGSRARTTRTERYVEVPWGGMRRTEAVANSTAQHLGLMLRELERIIAGL